MITKEIIEALLFYASEENWSRPEHPYSASPMDSIAMLDAGNKAREILEKIYAEGLYKEEEN